MSNSINVLEILFWFFAFIVFYTYIGYGILLYILVKIKESFKKRVKHDLPKDLPLVTLLIAAYNEEDIIAEKMINCKELNYPEDRLTIAWVTDGSTDKTNELLAQYPDVKVLFSPERRGKSAALNRAITFIETPIVIFTDANTMLCKDTVVEMVREFTDPIVGCIAGEKRVAGKDAQNAAGTEGIYWRYESALKDLDYRLYSAVGAAGELFAVRTDLYVIISDDTLLDDFTVSMKIAQKGYKIAYCKEAYAVEDASADMTQEAKRKVRIAAGGLQSIIRLRALLNIFRYGTLSFQYISHRVLRWSITPIMWFLLFPLNIILAIYSDSPLFYSVLLLLQAMFYILGLGGYILSLKNLKNKFLFIPYYFLFMNLCVLKGVSYLRKHKGSGAWEKAKRKNK